MKKLNSQSIGLITAGAMIAVSLLAFYAMHLPVENKFQYLVYMIFTGGIVWSLYNHAANNVTKNDFKHFFTAGFKTFITVALIMAVYTFVFFSFNTGFRDSRIAENAKMLLAEGNHLPNEIAENSKQLKSLFMPIMISSAVFRHLILGALISLIGAGFFSQKAKQATV